MKPVLFISNIMLVFFICNVSRTEARQKGADDLTPLWNNFPSNNAIYQAHDILRPNKRSLDVYRFFSFGLGKRNQATPEKKWLSSDYSDASAARQRPETSPSGFLHAAGQRDRLRRFLTDKVMPVDIGGLASEAKSKRVPEVYSEELYPVQAGKQQLEVKIDNSLLNNASYAAYSDKSEYPGFTNTEGDMKPLIGFLTQGDKNNKVTGNTQFQPFNKRWWAASRLASLRIPKSSMAFRRNYGKVFPDPALYFIGIGR